MVVFWPPFSTISSYNFVNTSQLFQCFDFHSSFVVSFKVHFLFRDFSIYIYDFRHCSCGNRCTVWRRSDESRRLQNSSMRVLYQTDSMKSQVRLHTVLDVFRDHIPVDLDTWRNRVKEPKERQKQELGVIAPLIGIAATKLLGN